MVKRFLCSTIIVFVCVRGQYKFYSPYNLTPKRLLAPFSPIFRSPPKKRRESLKRIVIRVQIACRYVLISISGSERGEERVDFTMIFFLFVLSVTSFSSVELLRRFCRIWSLQRLVFGPRWYFTWGIFWNVSQFSSCDPKTKNSKFPKALQINCGNFHKQSSEGFNAFVNEIITIDVDDFWANRGKLSFKFNKKYLNNNLKSDLYLTGCSLLPFID